MFDIKEQLKKLPELPGVYLMHDKEDQIIYVGKAKCLKNRVKQYFGPPHRLMTRTRAMVSRVAWFEYIVTDSELEALVLECTLIKKHKPRYNVLLKDDKHYPYIKVTLKDAYPRVLITRRMENDGARYFGPYSGMNTVKHTMEVIKRIFLIPTCHKNFPNDIGKQRPCLNYQIKKCMGVCRGEISQQEYHRIFEDICDFLQGSHQKLIAEMTEQMQQCAGKMDYEQAAALRDKISSIHQISQRQKIVSDPSSNQDLCAFACYDDIAFVEVFFVRSGRVNGRSSYRIEKVGELSDSEIMSEFVKQFYTTAVFIPDTLLLQHEIEDQEVFSDWLSERLGRRVKIEVPKRGEKVKLIKMVEKNAHQIIGDYKLEKLKRQADSDVLKKLAGYLKLADPPKRIEAYDISNTGGTNNVGAMIVFEDGLPHSELQRKFAIKTVEGADDYQSMQEMLWRRLMRARQEQEKIQNGELELSAAKFLPLPDLILIDGGKGHVNAAKKVAEELGFPIAIYGMVKDDKHKTRGLTDEKDEKTLPKNSATFALIGKIQEEVHRVAISYHKSLRTKSGIASELNTIEGIGEARRKLLLKKFKSVEAIRNASVEDLRQAGLDRKSAKNVYDHFR